jgi:hypothetical protein
MYTSQNIFKSFRIEGLKLDSREWNYTQSCSYKNMDQHASSKFVKEPKLRVNVNEFRKQYDP